MTNSPEELGVPPLATCMESAQRLLDALAAFLLAANEVERQSYVDAIGLAFVLQETIRFRAILALVRQQQFFAAASLLRGLWESRITLDYVLRCWPDPGSCHFEYPLDNVSAPVCDGLSG